MSPVRTAAEREEQAELTMLREQADRTADEVAQTLAELTRRIDVVRRAGEAARRISAARGTALRALRQGPRAIAAQPGVRRVALAAAPVLVLAVFACAARGKIKFGCPERARVFARPVRSSVRRRKQQRSVHRV